MSASFGFAPIPTTASGTVPDGTKQARGAGAPGPFHFNQVAVKVTEAGSHTSFVLTVEGELGSGVWVNLARSFLNPNSGLTGDENGIALTQAQAEAGVVLNFDCEFPRVRVGISGDNATVTGNSATITVRRTRS